MTTTLAGHVADGVRKEYENWMRTDCDEVTVYV